jgi:hypothetical protein
VHVPTLALGNAARLLGDPAYLLFRSGRVATSFAKDWSPGLIESIEAADDSTTSSPLWPEARRLRNVIAPLPLFPGCYNLSLGPLYDDRVKLAGWVLAAIACGAIASACTNKGTPCAAGDWEHCTCASGGTGYQQCTSDGESYGACDCSGTIPGIPSADAGSDAGAAADAQDAGLLPFMSPCSTNAECDTGLCFNFNARGSHCSKPCTQATDCPPPSTGCSGMNVCKSP